MTDQELNPTFAPGESPDFKSALESARLYYMRWGIIPVAVHYRSMKPMSDDWDKVEVTENNLQELFAHEPLNVGLQIGSKDLVDVSLGSPLARRAALYFLPKTGLISGRQSAPGSNYFYIVKGGVKYEKVKNTSAKKGEPEIVVELRAGVEGKPLFTLVAPSVHPDGDSYEWTEFGDPSIVDGRELSRSVHRLMAASLSAQSWPRDSRNDASIALAVVLYGLGWERSEAEHFVSSTALVADDDDADALVDIVQAAYERLEHGESITGFPTLEVIFDNKKLADRVVKHLKLGSNLVDDSQLTRSQQLKDFLSDLELFCTRTDQAYASFWVDGHRETWPIKSSRFEGWTRYTFFERYDRVLDTRAFNDVIDHLKAQAFRAPLRDVSTRIAELGEDIYINFGNSDWEVARVSAKGWHIENDPPVYFRRTKGLLPLPYPDREGSIDALRPFLNIESDKEWVLIAAWIIQALNANGPYPILSLVGAQGSAKSTFARVLKRLIDPHAAELRVLTNKLEDLMLTANNTWCLAFDNISEISDAVSAALCIISTGGTLVKRALYTNDDETILTAKRPCILTSIAEVMTQNDLQDRAILINVPMIVKENRRYEKEFWEEFDQVRGRVFGGILNLLSETLRHLPEVELQGAPRMADFAKLGIAVEKALGMDSGLFMQAYEEKRVHSIVQSLESSPVAAAILYLMKEKVEWKGRAGELLAALNEIPVMVDKEDKWPKKARGMTNCLNNLEPDLLRAGIKVERKTAPRGGGTIITLRRVEAEVEIQEAAEPQNPFLK